MKTKINSLIFEGKSVSMWKEPGIYILDFPVVSLKIADDQVEEVIEDLKKIIKSLNKGS